VVRALSEKVRRERLGQKDQETVIWNEGKGEKLQKSI